MRYEMGNDQQKMNLNFGENKESDEAVQYLTDPNKNKKLAHPEPLISKNTQMYQQQVKMFDALFQQTNETGQQQSITAEYQPPKSREEQITTLDKIQNETRALAKVDESQKIQALLQLMRNNMILLQNTQQQVEQLQGQLHNQKHKANINILRVKDAVHNPSTGQSDMVTVLRQRHNIP